MKPFNITGVTIKDASGGYTGYFAEFPEVVAEGETKKEVRKNLVDAFVAMLEARRQMSKNEREGIQDSESENYQLSLA